MEVDAITEIIAENLPSGFFFFVPSFVFLLRHVVYMSAFKRHWNF